jgi:hypothetical protein
MKRDREGRNAQMVGACVYLLQVIGQRKWISSLSEQLISQVQPPSSDLGWAVEWGYCCHQGGMTCQEEPHTVQALFS